MHPFQAFGMPGTVGYLSSYLPPNSPLTHENAIQNSRSAVSSIPQSCQHNNTLSVHENIELNTQAQDLSEKDTNVMKNYPLNIPQLSTRIFQDNSNTLMNELVDSQSITSTLTADIPLNSIGMLHKIYCPSKMITENTINLSENMETETENNKFESLSVIKKNDVDAPENLIQKSQIATSVTKSLNNEENRNSSKDDTKHVDSVNYNISSPKSSLTEGKRKSLEKTVRLIESILINSTNNSTKSPIATKENSITQDPLAISPKSNISNQNSNDSSTDSDDEALIHKVSKPKTWSSRSPSKKILSQKRSHVLEYETKVQLRRHMESESLEEVVVKVEDTSSLETQPVNPFHCDCNGVQKTDVDSLHKMNPEYSIAEAINIIKKGTKSSSYFECPYCSLLLLHPKRFLIHTKWHSFGLINEKRAEMAREREKTIRERRLAKLNQRPNDANGEEKSFPCKDCDKVFARKSTLKGHRQKFHLSEVQECKICSVKVEGMKALRTHMSIHEDKDSGGHQCPSCSKRFKFRHSLAKHIGTHQEKTHACSECSKMFGSEQLLKLHMKTHERMARGTTYHCSYCGKGFYEPYNLSVHERTHRNDKPFKCDICGSCFVTNSSLKRHVKVSHSASGAKPHVCTVCQKCFSTASIRDRHQLRLHSDPALFPYRCHLCSRRYMKPKDLKSHMYKTHPKEKTNIIPIEIEVEPMSS